MTEHTAAHPASEVLEEYAEGSLKGIYQDIRQTLRVPFVHFVFRVLATEPNYLRVAWRHLHTNAQTAYFEQQADGLRRYAVHAMSEMGEVRIPVSDDAIPDVVRIFHYLDPKVLLAVGAFRIATTGQLPPLAALVSEEKRQVVPDVPSGMQAPETIEPDRADERIRELYDRISAGTGFEAVSDEYRALARWPDFLQGSWNALHTRDAAPQFRRASGELRRMTEEAVLGFPFRMDIGPHTLRHSGLSEAQIDNVRSILDRSYRLLSELVLNIAVIATGLDGRRRAAESPFPITLIGARQPEDQSAAQRP